MEITIERNHSPVLVLLSGALDNPDAHDGLRRSVEPLLNEQGHSVVVDMAEVARINSEGLGVLASLGARSNLRGGSLVWARPSTYVDQVLRLTKLSTFLTIAPDRA
jgi:anti-anti-sigma factor